MIVFLLGVILLAICLGISVIWGCLERIEILLERQAKTLERLLEVSREY